MDYLEKFLLLSTLSAAIKKKKKENQKAINGYNLKSQNEHQNQTQI